MRAGSPAALLGRRTARGPEAANESTDHHLPASERTPSGNPGTYCPAPQAENHTTGGMVIRADVGDEVRAFLVVEKRHVHPHRSPVIRRPAAIIAVAPEKKSASSCRAATPNIPSPFCRGLRHPGRQRPGRRGSATALRPRNLLADIPTPKQVMEHLDRSVVGQAAVRGGEVEQIDFFGLMAASEIPSPDRPAAPQDGAKVGREDVRSGWKGRRAEDAVGPGHGHGPTRLAGGSLTHRSAAPGPSRLVGDGPA